MYINNIFKIDIIRLVFWLFALCQEATILRSMHTIHKISKEDDGSDTCCRANKKDDLKPEGPRSPARFNGPPGRLLGIHVDMTGTLGPICQYSARFSRIWRLGGYQIIGLWSSAR